MELTREQVEERLSGAQQGHLFAADVVEELCTALIAEMDNPKVWDGAPDWATDARVRWTDRNGVTGHNELYSQLYTRIPAKSRIDEIAEELAETVTDKLSVKDQVIGVIKLAIMKDREEREAEK